MELGAEWRHLRFTVVVELGRTSENNLNCARNYGAPGGGGRAHLLASPGEESLKRNPRGDCLLRLVKPYRGRFSAEIGGKKRRERKGAWAWCLS